MGEASKPSGAGPAPNAPGDVVDALAAPMVGDRAIRLEMIGEAHREPLRAACAQDQQIWDIYPVSMINEHFDPVFDAMLPVGSRIALIAFQNDIVVGTTSYLAVDATHHLLEIGGTYFAPSVRGSGFNSIVKHLMINRAIACGFTRVELRADERNTRSCAAIAKLGAVKEGVLRKNRITWTGHVRDTAVFSILADEWTAQQYLD
jgi:RimJ/RimL family protein N-acetyltransferase